MMRPVIAIFTLLLTASAGDWTLAKEKSGIAVYTREVAGSDFVAFRGETVVEGSVATLIAIMYDIPNAPAWLYNCSFSMTVEERGFKDNIIFQTYDLPFPAGDRQVMLEAKLVWSAESARLETRESNRYCDGRQTERCKRVRGSGHIMMERSRGSYTFRQLDENRTKVVWQQHLEPGGIIPAWLANALVIDIPFNTLRQLQSMVKDTKYRTMTESDLRRMWLEQYKQFH